MGQAICIFTSPPDDFESLKVKKKSQSLLSAEENQCADRLSHCLITHNQGWKWIPASCLPDSTTHNFSFLTNCLQRQSPKIGHLVQAQFRPGMEYKTKFEVLFPARDFPGVRSGKESAWICLKWNKCRFSPWVGKIPWGRKWQFPPIFLPGKSHKQGSLMGYSSWSRKKPDMTEQACNNSLQMALRWFLIGRHSGPSPARLPRANVEALGRQYMSLRAKISD